MNSKASAMVTPAAPASGCRIRRYPVTPRMIALSRYKRNPYQVKARIAFTSQNMPLIARTQPRARIENFVALCAFTTHTAPRTASRMPHVKNHPQDLLTCSRPVAKKSERPVIILLLLLDCHYLFGQHG